MCVPHTDGTVWKKQLEVKKDLKRVRRGTWLLATGSNIQIS